MGGHRGRATRPADGFFLVNELRLPRKQATSPPGFAASLQEAIKAITTAIAYPIRYAGPGEWTVFFYPRPYKALPTQTTIAILDTTARDHCLFFSHEL